ncbi:hypothetical protein LR48_Vigan151s001700 [Vigna angularis]|uniref:Uncharacterized protein n=1 Tax=Phaseolus angularis TaxID=3914 RepID=A0A0L9T521_PHAAN|nr:hypothetical protein LR48_Vigan151s001700 [Vigna angularis]
MESEKTSKSAKGEAKLPLRGSLPLSGTQEVTGGGDRFCTCVSGVLATKSVREVELGAFGVARRPRCCKFCGGGFKGCKGSLQEVRGVNFESQKCTCVF